MARRKKKTIKLHKDYLMHQSWCLKNDIYVEPVSVDNYNYIDLVVHDKGQRIVEGRYPQLPSSKLNIKKGIKDSRWGWEVFSLYTKYYDKYNTQ